MDFVILANGLGGQMAAKPNLGRLGEAMHANPCFPQAVPTANSPLHNSAPDQTTNVHRAMKGHAPHEQRDPPGR